MNTSATIIEALAEHARTKPSALAFAAGGREISYADLYHGARRQAQAFQRRGLTVGARCALLMGTSLDLVQSVFAVQLAGGIPVVMNTSLPQQGLQGRLQMIEPAMVLTESDDLNDLDVEAQMYVAEELIGDSSADSATLPQPREDAIAYLQITSGTTGEPKAAAITHRNLMASISAAQRRLELSGEDIMVAWVPMHHDLGLVRFLFGNVYLGARAYLLPPSIASMGEWLRTMSEVRATLTGSPDFGYRVASRTVKAGGIDLSSLRFATNGGEPARLSTIEAFESRFGCPGAVRPGYGLAEATLGVSALARGEPLQVDATGSVSTGQAFEGVNIRIADDHDQPVAVSEVGHIQVSGAPVFAGYFNDTRTNGEVFTLDGWLRTGDTGALDATGNLYVHGRTRAMIKRAGALVAPFEAEQAVDSVDGVRICAAVGIESNGLVGAEDVAIVAEIRESAITPEGQQQISDQISQAAAGAMGFAPAEVLLVAPRTIPLTANGKIRHAILKEQLRRSEVKRLA